MTQQIIEEPEIERPKGRLRQGLRRFDVFFLLLCSLVGLDTIGALAASGPEAFAWLLVFSVVFFVPYGLIVSELSSTFPLEGGQYTWVRMAFGRGVASVAQFVYWLSNPVWVGGALAVVALATFQTFIHPLPGAWTYVFGLAFVWAGVLAVSVSLEAGRWVPIAGAVARIVLLGFFFVSTVVYGVIHGVQPLTASDFSPSYLGFLALAPLIVFTFVGFEVSSAAAEEMEAPQRTIPLGVMRSGLAAFLMVAAPVVAILVVLPRDQVSHLSGFLDAAKLVFTIYGGHVGPDGTVELTGAGEVIGVICAAGVIIALFTSGVSWAIGESRAQATACSDGSGPAWLGQISERFGTPVRINVLAGILATVVMVAALNFTSGDIGKYFSVGLNLAISMTMVAYLVMFPALMVLDRKYPDANRPFRIPGGTVGRYLCSAAATLVVIFTLVQLLYPGAGLGLFGSPGTPDDALPAGFAGDRLGYELGQLIPMGLFIAMGIGFYLIGQREMRRADRTLQAVDDPLG
ncbi:APC family permease [Mycolicibacterium brisbanense]|uniref:Amino acid permease n=1 Tax=Mycolicibacterium brisbanense TaxID=146020 RepID=A0A100W0P7_9MYCO|nr:APC family permease [Mycolicibacterium brisbanense]MCV7160251.1 APC family permease [Mycolicibacterium brisbanense]GAS89411.1 uncharacterized protein RMCB_3507 [Mycolicibacterium brisbanense]